MGNLERQLLDSANEGAAGSGSALGAHLLSKMKEGKADPKITHEALRMINGVSSPETHAKTSTAESKDVLNESKTAIKEETSDLKKIKDHTQKDLSRIEGDRAVVTNEIREIKTRIKEATEAGHANIAKNWETRLKKAVDVLGMIEKTSPTIKSFSDEAILEELKNYRHARHQQEQAELRVNKGEDLKAQGDYSRAQSEAFAISQRIEDLIKTKKESALPENSSPAQTDSVIFSAEDALTEKKEREHIHTTPQAEQGEMSSFSLPEATSLINEAPTLETDIPEITPELNFVDETPTYRQGEVIEFIQPNETTIQKTTEEVAPAQENSQPETETKTAENILGKISTLNERVDSRAEKAGVLDKIRSVGKKWNSLPKHYKLLFAGGLFLSGAGATIVGSAVFGGAVVSLATASRALAGAGAFAGFEEIMRKSHERKTGKPITEEAAARQTILAGTLAVLIGSMLPTAMHNMLDFAEPVEGMVVTGKLTTPLLLPDEVLESSKAAHNKGLLDLEQAIKEGNPETIRLTEETLGLTHEEALKSIHDLSITPPTEEEFYAATHPTETSQLKAAEGYTETAEPGDSVWKMTERQLEAQYGEKFTELPTEKQTYIINAVKERIAQHPGSFGMVDANKLDVGQSINFGQILNDKEFMDGQFADVKEIKTLEEITVKETTTPEQKIGEEVVSEQGEPEDLLKAELGEREFEQTIYASEKSAISQSIQNHPEIPLLADIQLKGIVKEIFGSKGGFLGFGSSDGMKIFNSFADRSVDEITKLDARTLELNEGANTGKMQDFLDQAREKTHVKAMPGEKVGDYLHRATTIAIINDKFPKK